MFEKEASVSSSKPAIVVGFFLNQAKSEGYFPWAIDL